MAGDEVLVVNDEKMKLLMLVLTVNVKNVLIVNASWKYYVVNGQKRRSYSVLRTDVRGTLEALNAALYLLMK